MMNSHNIFFRLNSTENVVITLEDPIEYLHPCYEEYIILSQNGKSIYLADGPIYYNMQQLVEYINKALKNELPLDSSITQDIGYVYNEYYYEENNFDDNDLPINTQLYYIPDWIGYQYYVWTIARKGLRLITWIYNDKNDDIIFEITPLYPYMYCDPEEEPNYISYDEWIKTYKPYLIRTLSRETAQAWLSQAEFLIKTMDEYVRKWEEEQKKLDKK